MYSLYGCFFGVAEIGAIIGQDFWRHDYESRDVNKSAVTGRAADGEALTEDFSDHCIAKVLGTTALVSLIVTQQPTGTVVYEDSVCWTKS